MLCQNSTVFATSGKAGCADSPHLGFACALDGTARALAMAAVGNTYPDTACTEYALVPTATLRDGRGARAHRGSIRCALTGGHIPLANGRDNA